MRISPDASDRNNRTKYVPHNVKLEVPSKKMVQFRDQEETQRLHCERQALWRGVCPRRAERDALARAGMARAGAGDMGDTYLKQHDAPEDVEYYLCGPPMMAKTVLDLLHSLGVDDADIRFDNFGG